MRSRPEPTDGKSFDRLIEQVCKDDEPVLLERKVGREVIVMTLSAYNKMRGLAKNSE
jgi:PHD/YefM family antitoxin component YafN of YafNO toxin-antitoxin module